MAKLSASMTSKTASAVQEIYRPIIRGYFAVFAAYYLLLLPTNFMYYQGLDLWSVVGIASLTSAVAVAGFFRLRTKVSIELLERLLVVLNFLVVMNVVVTLNLMFAPEKLVYFVILVMLFALASVSTRQSVLSIVFSCLAFLTFVPRIGAGDQATYGFLTFGAIMASVSITYYLRKAITYIATAKLDAEDQLEEARVVGESLRHKSLSDSLTGLPNRRAFFEALRKSKHEVTRHEKESRDDPRAPVQNLWLILVDLDGFKAVNDVHGHLVGDLLLKEVSNRLSAHCGETAHVSRMGGDEFNIILKSSGDETVIKGWCDELLEELAKSYVIEGRYVRISGSMGCKMMDLTQGARSQINEADYALMAAKKQGKNRSVIFTAAHAKQADERYKVEQALRFASLPDEIELLYQPQVDLRQNRIVRAEALARWSSPIIGDVEPSKFIKVAEESGLITQITLTVVEQAFRTLSLWAAPVPIAINLSCHDLISDPSIDQIIDMAREFKIDPTLVEFEVTETAMMIDLDKATTNLKRLSEMGFSIALDDFGTGYSNFSYLRRLPIEKLKVDRSLMENSGDPMTEKVLFSLAGMARTLGVECLLEGIESEVDLLVAKRVGADAVQGFLFGQPMSVGELSKVLENEAREKASPATVTQ